MTDLALLECTQIDQQTWLLTVRDRVVTRGWFRRTTHDTVTTYALDAYAGWFDRDRRVNAELAARLFELFFSWRCELAISRYIGIDVDGYVLPPVPFAPRRPVTAQHQPTGRVSAPVRKARQRVS